MDIKKSVWMALESVRHPSKNSKPMTVEQTMKFYYGVAIPAFVLAVIINLILYFSVGTYRTVAGSAMNLMGGNGALSVAGAIGLPALMLFIITPISLLISAAVYQLFAKLLFDLVKKDYSRTFHAFVLGVMPSLLLFWLYGIPIVGIAVSIVAGVWSIVVLIISLAKQQGINYKQAVGTYLVSVFTLAAIIFVVVAGVLAAAVGVLVNHGFPLGSMMGSNMSGWSSMAHSGSSALGCTFPVNPASSPQCVVDAFQSSGYYQILNFSEQEAALGNPIAWLGSNPYLCTQYPSYFTSC
ncbi:MAG: YIP1 family protein [Candidatus Micrarchaeota archaeon]|nr:YIP1 family protein [Candidatus Micrarchaeota archaeon]